jgi:hypothetical protein
VLYVSTIDTTATHRRHGIATDVDRTHGAGKLPDPHDQVVHLVIAWRLVDY